MSADFTIKHGLAAGHERTAAELYWQAFGEKLGKLLGPKDRGIGFFKATINPSSIISATTQDGQLLGVSAVQLNGKGFTDAGASDLLKHYGLGALWRMIPLSMLERTPPPDTLQMDGICVSEIARGMGVGTALLDAVFQCARDQGLGQVTLDVINTNPRAKALYERKGFVATSEESTSILRPLLGFDSATKMVRSV